MTYFHRSTIDSALGGAIGEMLRDRGHVMWCQACKRAETPGAIRCGKCGRAVVQARTVAQRQATEEAA